ARVIELYWHPLSIMPWRVRIALREKGLAYESVKVNVYGTSERSAEFLRLNPFGQIPVLVDDGLAIAESMAIVEYLEERYPEPPLMPADAATRARVRQWMGWSTDYWPLAWKKWIAPRLPDAQWTDASVAQGRCEIAMHLDVLESALATREWIVERYS